MTITPTGFANTSALGAVKLVPVVQPAGFANTSALGVPSFTTGQAPVESGIFVVAEVSAKDPSTGDKMLYASDSGYRTAPTDPGGPVPYPARISESVVLTRSIDVSPGASAAAVAWGSVYLANPDGAYNSVSAWNNDGRSVVIKYGRKRYDKDRQYWRDPNYGSLFTLFSGVQEPWRIENTALVVPLRDATYWLDRPIQSAQYGGTGGYDGSSDMSGVRKPKLRGLARNITPVLIDPANLIYQYTDGPGQVLIVWEGGVGTFGFPAESDTTNLYAGSVSPGRYRTDNSRGLIQLGSVPTYPITLDAAGHFPVAGYKYGLVDIARYLLTEDASVPAQYVDAAEYAAAAASFPATGGWYWSPSDDATGVDAVTHVLSGVGMKLVPRRSGTLGIVRPRALTGSETPVATLNTATAVSITARPLPPAVAPPPWRIRAGYRFNFTQQTSGYNPTATAARQQFMASPSLYTTWSDAAVQAAYARPNDLGPVLTSLDQSADSLALATAWGALWGTRRRLLDIVVPLSVGLALDLGDVVRVVWPVDDLASGALGQIVGDNLRTADAAITLTVLL